MTLPENSAFWPDEQPIVEIDWKIGRTWKQQGIEFCSNNGWDWQGNAFLLSLSVGNEYLEEQLEPLGINWRDYITYHEGYYTNFFGFYEDISDDGMYAEMSLDALNLCEEILDELGIKWNGWAGAASFTLVATETQILELIERLKEPIEQWRQTHEEWKPW